MHQPAVEVVRIVVDRVVWATAGAVEASMSSFADCTTGFGPFRVSGYVCAPLFFYCAQRRTGYRPGVLNPDVCSNTMGYASIWILPHTSFEASFSIHGTMTFSWCVSPRVVTNPFDFF
jgi:hypothetical protein